MALGLVMVAMALGLVVAIIHGSVMLAAVPCRVVLDVMLVVWGSADNRKTQLYHHNNNNTNYHLILHINLLLKMC
jgi:hypothetical protein